VAGAFLFANILIFSTSFLISQLLLFNFFCEIFPNFDIRSVPAL